MSKDPNNMTLVELEVAFKTRFGSSDYRREVKKRLRKLIADLLQVAEGFPRAVHISGARQKELRQLLKTLHDESLESVIAEAGTPPWNARALTVWERAVAEAIRFEHNTMNSGHLLLGIMLEDSNPIVNYLKIYHTVTVRDVRIALEAGTVAPLSGLTMSTTSQAGVRTGELQEILTGAVNLARGRFLPAVTVNCLLAEMFNSPNAVAVQIMAQLKVDLAQLRAGALAGLKEDMAAAHPSTESIRGISFPPELKVTEESHATDVSAFVAHCIAAQGFPIPPVKGTPLTQPNPLTEAWAKAAGTRNDRDVLAAACATLATHSELQTTVTARFLETVTVGDLQQLLRDLTDVITDAVKMPAVPPETPLTCSLRDEDVLKLCLVLRSALSCHADIATLDQWVADYRKRIYGPGV